MKDARYERASAAGDEAGAATIADDGPSTAGATSGNCTAPGSAARALVVVALVTAAAAIGVATADATYPLADEDVVAGAATASRLLLNALLAPALDADAQPLRFVDPRPSMGCGIGSALRVDGRRLEAATPVPLRPFELHWQLDDCKPFGRGGPRFDGAVRLRVFREDHGFGAIVTPLAHDPLRITLPDGRRHFIEHGTRAMPQRSATDDPPPVTHGAVRGA